MLGDYFEIGLKTQKSAQFGVLHTWQLYVNDLDVKMCLVLPQLACDLFRLFFVLGCFNTYGSWYNNTGKGPK